MDQDKKNYLLQSFLKKERWKDTEANTNRTDEKGIDEKKGVQSTIMTRHMEMEKDTVEGKYGGPVDEPKIKPEEIYKKLPGRLTKGRIKDMVIEGFLTEEEGRRELTELVRRESEKLYKNKKAETRTSTEETTAEPAEAAANENTAVSRERKMHRKVALKKTSRNKSNKGETPQARKGADNLEEEETHSPCRNTWRNKEEEKPNRIDAVSSNTWQPSRHTALRARCFTTQDYKTRPARGRPGTPRLGL